MRKLRRYREGSPDALYVLYKPSFVSLGVMSLASPRAAPLATDGLFNFRDPIPFAASPIASPLAPSKSLKQEAEVFDSFPKSYITRLPIVPLQPPPLTPSFAYGAPRLGYP